MARAHFVKQARKDNPVAKKGESYWWWSFRFGGKHYSRTKPKPSQLTQSEFLGTLLSIQEEIEAISVTDLDELEALAEEFADQLEQLGEEQNDKRDNMPEQLQDSDTGQMLESRYESCQEMADEIRNIDFSCDEDVDEQDRLEECLNELQAIEYNGE